MLLILNFSWRGHYKEKSVVVLQYGSGLSVDGLSFNFEALSSTSVTERSRASSVVELTVLCAGTQRYLWFVAWWKYLSGQGSSVSSLAGFELCRYESWCRDCSTSVHRKWLLWKSFTAQLLLYYAVEVSFHQEDEFCSSAVPKQFTSAGLWWS